MWIHVPSTSSVSVQDTEALSLDSKALSLLEQSATWKTKSVSLQSLRRVWKTVPSIRRLSGLTFAPSTQNRGVERWISSLEDSHVSHIRSREEGSGKLIQENSQEKSLELQPDWDTQLSFLKMSPESCASTMTTSDQAYKKWATPLRKDSLRRQKLAHHTRGNGSLSWRTPASQESGIRPARLEEAPGSRMYDKETGRLAQYGLPQQVQNWPTPDAYNDPIAGGSVPWQKSYKPGKQIHLHHAVRMNWPTPTGRDHKDGTSAETVPENGLLGRAAPNWANSRSIPQTPTTTKDGHTCSPSCRRLNPLFAEMLMGLPQGWSDDSEPLATGLFQQWRHSLGRVSAGLYDNGR